MKLLVLMLSLTSCAPSMELPWGKTQVHRMIQVHNCTVYTNVLDPYEFWNVCYYPNKGDQ